ncbi:MAG TPA: BTAD domain-containing putative transcriptional regulator, partial [Mycobacteriales bacterium]
MRVGILGPLRVEDGAGRPVEVGGARLRGLLYRLALDAGRPVGVPTLIDALWGGSLPADELNALQSLVSRLRRALPDPALVDSGPAGYRLAVRPDDVDASLFERLAGAGRRALAAGDHQRAAAVLGEALALWRGPALADADGLPWATTAAARLEERRLAATEDRIEAELALGDAPSVLAELEVLAAEHPLRERLRGQLVRALYAAGRQADALRAYEDVRRRLADELGVDPSPALREVHLQVLRADPALAAETPAGPTNLPAPLTSFVGRDADVDRIVDLVAGHRLVTLVGAGGAGKTRLATETGDRLRRRFPDGVWLVELAAVTGGMEVPPAVLAALASFAVPDGQQAGAQQDATSRLVEALKNRRALIVLDNCEHVIEAAARTTADLLARCPELEVLATSREPLAITGEALAPVPPLGLPPESATPEEALVYPAVALFADRAAAACPGFAVDAATVGHVMEVCRRLDGLPLAIELAAARLRSLPLAEVAGRLDDRFRLLTGGSRTALPRHQTLRAVVAWSWDLLSAEETRLADRLAVFPGGVTPAAAAAVSSEDVSDLLVALVDKSLLQQVPGGGLRYRMLETLREYGTERLAASGELAAVRRAHAAHFLHLAEEAEPHLRRPEQVEWMSQLTADQGNLTAALRFAVDTGDADTAIRLAAALSWYWTVRGDHASAARWLAAAADMPGDAPPAARATCLAMAGVSGAAVGADFASMRARMEQAKALDVGGWADHPMLSLFEPVAAMLGGQPAEALRMLTERPDPDDPWARATRLFLAAMLYETEGMHAEHRHGLKEALEAYREARRELVEQIG